MKSTTVTRVGSVVLVVVALVFGAAVADALGGSRTEEEGIATTATTSDGGAVSMLFALRAESMVSTTSGDSTSMVLSGVAPEGEWFTDRPLRRSGTVPLDTLITEFFGAKSGTPPNASVAGVANGRGFLSTVELRSPRWDATTRMLSFDAIALSDRSDSLLPSFAQDVSVTVDLYSQTCTVNIDPQDGLQIQISSGPEAFYGSNVSIGNSDPLWSDGSMELTQSGSWGYGCIGSVGIGISLPPRPPTATELGTLPSTVQMCTIDWSNPETGENSWSVECAWNPSSGIETVLTTSSGPHGDTALWDFVVVMD